MGHKRAVRQLGVVLLSDQLIFQHACHVRPRRSTRLTNCNYEQDIDALHRAHRRVTAV